MWYKREKGNFGSGKFEVSKAKQLSKNVTRSENFGVHDQTSTDIFDCPKIKIYWSFIVHIKILNNSLQCFRKRCPYLVSRTKITSIKSVEVNNTS